MGCGIVACHRELANGAEHSKGGLYVCIGCFVAYLIAAIWYAREIRRGTWQQIWLNALEQLGGG